MKFLVSIVLALLPVAVVAGTPVDALIERVAEGGARNVTTRIVDSPDGDDFFEISARRGKVLIEGNNSVSIATGFNWYLKYVANIHISWNGLTCPMPDRMPLPAATIRRSTDHAIRYYLNFCTFSYSMAFWDWARWEKELDWMALHGVNLPLSMTGNEVVWRNLMRRIGYTDEEIGRFIAGPAFLAWWEMNNLEGWGGPNPDEWYAQQEALQLRILARMRELGIEPVFPGWSGMVPSDIGAKMGWNATDQGTWNGFRRPAFLRPDDPNFDTFADMYYEEMERVYGRADYFAIDPFHEGGSTEGIDVAQAGRTILAAVKRANPAAVWVIQGWQGNPRREILDAIAPGDLLALDLYSDKRPKWGDPNSMWYDEKGYGQHSWVFCELLNFGGRTGLNGTVDKVVNGYYDARERCGDRLCGVGATPEAIENNAVMYELLYELPWRPERFSPDEWLDGYLTARYGKVTEGVRQAWGPLWKTVYNAPWQWPGDGPVECLACARPGLNLKSTSSWGSAVPYYDASVTRLAADAMAADAALYRGNNNFEYDLVDLKRQALADRANVLEAEFSAAYAAHDTARFFALADEFMGVIDDMNTLLATRPEFRLDTWTEQARACMPAHADWMEWNARTLITAWGPREASNKGGLHEYSYRQWHGLMELYGERWALFFKALRDGTPVPDWFTIEEEWTRQ